MRALVQRVKSASVTIENEVVGAIEDGLLILVCSMEGDSADLPQKLALKTSKLRIFKDDEGRMNRSLKDIGGAVLVVSQFTLAADTSRGNRPGFSAASKPEIGEREYQSFCKELSALDIDVQTGRFGADMQVALINDGPVTIWLEV